MQRIGHAILGAAILGAIAQSASAAVISFEGGTELADNFRQLNAGAIPLSQTANGATNDYIYQDNTSGAGARVLVYDTTPADATAGTASSFAGSFSVQFDISSSQAGSSFGVLLGDPAAEASGTALLALFNIDATGTTDRIRFFRGANLSTAVAGTLVGTAVDGATMDTSADTADSWTSAQVAYSVVGGVPQITMTVGTLTATSAFIASDLIATPEVALRIFDSAGAGTARVDNLAVVPEPAAVGIIGLAATGLIARRRRA